MKKILVLGNSISRLNSLVDNFIKNWTNDLAVCNNAYKEIQKYPQISCVVSVHPDVAQCALEFRANNNYAFRIISIRENGSIEGFIKYRGWSTGMECIHQFILEEYDEIYMAGFEFDFGKDIYMGKVVTSNFKKQYETILEEFPKKKIIWIDHETLSKL